MGRQVARYQPHSRVLVAESKDAAIAALRKQQIIVTAVTEKGKEFAMPKIGGKIGHKEIAIFTRQFSVMIDAGLPLVQSRPAARWRSAGT